MDIKSFIESLGEKKEELVNKAAQCKNSGELLALAQEIGLALDEEGAKELFNAIYPKSGQLSDDELDSVAGGNNVKPYVDVCPGCRLIIMERGISECPRCHTNIENFYTPRKWKV